MNFLTKTISAITPIADLIKNSTTKKLKENFIAETPKDIEALKAIKNIYLKNKLIDSDEEEHYLTIYCNLKNLYKNFYCPHFYKIKKLNHSEKIQYLMLRVIIDETLKVEDTTYKI